MCLNWIQNKKKSQTIGLMDEHMNVNKYLHNITTKVYERYRNI